MYDVYKEIEGLVVFTLTTGAMGFGKLQSEMSDRDPSFVIRDRASIANTKRPFTSLPMSQSLSLMTEVTGFGGLSVRSVRPGLELVVRDRAGIANMGRPFASLPVSRYLS